MLQYKKRKLGRYNKRPVEQVINTPVQVTMTWHNDGRVTPRPIYIGKPVVPYIPKDPGRARRLIAANAKINKQRSRDAATAK
jgi:hypothetical protein